MVVKIGIFFQLCTTNMFRSLITRNSSALALRGVLSEVTGSFQAFRNYHIPTRKGEFDLIWSFVSRPSQNPIV